MTLTIERLKWLHDAATELSATKLKMTMRPDELLVLTREILANREAQPVYQYRMRNPYNGQVTDWETTKPEQVDFILKETIAANVEFRIIAAPPAPAVPGELLDAMEEVIRISDRDHEAWDKAKAAITACRAAMLAQPVSSGYKFPDDTQRMDWLVAHHVTVRKPLRYGSEAMFTAQTITDEEDDYHATKLREQIDAAMLAAAPEGGNVIKGEQA